MTTINIIMFAVALAAFAAEVYLAVRIVRKRNQLIEDLEDLDIEKKALQKKRNDLDLWERQIKGDAKYLRPQDYYEEVTISAADRPSKKKARKSLASKFGYDVIDLIKIHETKNEDGSATYSAELRFLHKEDQR